MDSFYFVSRRISKNSGSQYFRELLDREEDLNLNTDLYQGIFIYRIKPIPLSWKSRDYDDPISLMVNLNADIDSERILLSSDLAFGTMDDVIPILQEYFYKEGKFFPYV